MNFAKGKSLLFQIMVHAMIGIVGLFLMETIVIQQGIRPKLKENTDLLFEKDLLYQAECLRGYSRGDEISNPIIFDYYRIVSLDDTVISEGGDNAVFDSGDLNFVVRKAPIPQTDDLFLEVAVDEGELYHQNEKMLMEIWGVWLILIVGALAFAICFSFKVEKPVRILTDAMIHLNTENDEPIVVDNQVYEINKLVEAFNKMQHHIQVLLKQVVEEQKEKRAAQQKALQAQIAPHFLYNTLDTISWKALDYGATDVADMISALSSFFRVSLSDGKEYITWEEEVEHIYSYLFIQQIRYEEKMEYELYLDEKISDYVIPKLILQPLVENALYHGIKEKDAKGKIDVRIDQCADDQAKITVEDTGAGMSADKLEEVRKIIRGEEKEKGYGLYNLSQRLQMAYENNYQFRVVSKEGKGTRIEIEIPLERCEKQ